MQATTSAGDGFKRRIMEGNPLVSGRLVSSPEPAKCLVSAV
jgi:hypothetical protein